MSTVQRNAHCSFCGHRYDEGQPWPRTCKACKQITYRNPLPVAVALVPIDDGLLTVRRGIEPRKGLLALPGGYVNLGESWQEAAAREVFEETQLKINPQGIRDFRVKSAPDGTVLIFGLSEPHSKEALSAFTPSEETSEVVIVRGQADLAFPIHTEVARAYFEMQHAPETKTSAR